MAFDRERALQLLRLGTQNDIARFRDGQEGAIRHVVEGLGRLLVVQKTGWGKSSVYFIAAKLLREQGMGPAVLISPLLALMRNQIAAAERMGVRAQTIHSENENEWHEVEAAIQRDEVDILLISPERLGNERFRSGILATIAPRISLLVVDEAHCVSDWGHDFRPQYRMIERIVRALPRNMRLLATTATANNRVLEDLQAVLGPDLEVVRGDLSRPSLLLQTIKLPSQAERLAWLAENLPRINGSGIIYTLTVRDAQRVTEWLRTRGINVEAYTSLSEERRPDLENALLSNQLKGLVATMALGMGFDKPDLAFVIHYQMPGSVVAYYQQVGRAGRAIGAAHGVLLSGAEESDINDYFIASAFPSRKEVAQVLNFLREAPDGLSINELMDRINASKSRIEKSLLLLSLESPAPLVKQGSKWKLTAAELSPAFWDRADRLTTLRRQEQRQMQEYVDLQTGHMEFLVSALDGELESHQVPELRPLPVEVNQELVRDAVAFLRRTRLPIEPRKMWPPGGLPALGVQGRIPSEKQAQLGYALCAWGDAGWGAIVRAGKYNRGRFADDLVQACAILVRGWAPEPFPAWVTCIPSRRHPEIVPEFARRLANALQLPFYSVLEQTADRREQKDMANSSQQAHNLDGSLAVTGGVMPEPVLLVDDMVKSRWTFTVAAWLLKSAGSGPVYPLALAAAAVTTDQSV
jgi:ATP-dependent DNA helicase RecQ